MHDASRSKAVLVTGASSGIGRAIAVRLRDEGWSVIGLGRSRDALDALAQECGAQTLNVDVRDTAEVTRQLGGQPLDAVIHAAGVLSSRELFQDIDPQAIDQMVATNLTAPLHLTRALLPQMIDRQQGHFVFVGSSAGRWPHPNASVYGATKAAISLFCDALRCDLLGTGVRVTEVAPGRVQTQLYKSTLGDDAGTQLYDGYASIQPTEIADIVLSCLQLPAHVDVSRMEVFPTDQAVGGARIVKMR
jgi:NADP-dependent 3-hydroxy acid dehydrogenase YdfG